jgi:hypothetical protein
MIRYASAAIFLSILVVLILTPVKGLNDTVFQKRTPYSYTPPQTRASQVTVVTEASPSATLNPTLRENISKSAVWSSESGTIIILPKDLIGE